ncbi:proline-rich protein 14-like [Protopterus annectens]|uniref:proline-rich protein 14-like n=1 Tax=Protopterus annectens TaxID=7888 RepID=UPI001CFBB76D|nr:proline-rich protein 14-like [Protopterus annectens]
MNKNYVEPPKARAFEKIFEEPFEKNGKLIFTSQRKVKCFMEFFDGTLQQKPQKFHILRRLNRKNRGQCKEKGPDWEALLCQRLAELDAVGSEAEEGTSTENCNTIP